ncbi:hypothetical protein [uncultured Cyclobacterium sp.]|uniref:hypothetical protein n=1 Tax=uncultured Cyclobacterium sp. TaxID=453820 RepID=UPI0030EDB3A4|tara:strand:+ start:60781 stop:61473 length:693 start_codon:yes stop_codon:yes gene_type:complete
MKKLTFNTVYLTLLLLLFAFGAQAHALWIHTSSTTEIGARHDFKVYYADYHENAIEAVADWYSDVQDFELWLISPSGKKTKLEPIANEDHFEGSFAVEEKGEYQLQISHTAKVLKGTTAYQFNAYAQVWAGKGKKVSKQQKDLSLTRNPKSSVFLVKYKDDALADAPINVLGPENEVQKIITGKKGKASANMQENGKYYAEVTYTDKLNAGDPSGLKAIWRCATQVIEME